MHLGDDRAAIGHLRRAVELWVRHGEYMTFSWTLELLLIPLARSGFPVPVARIAGHRDALDHGVTPGNRQRYADSLATARAYADGVWVCELAALREPGLVPEALAAVLRVAGRGGEDLLVGFPRFR